MIQQALDAVYEKGVFRVLGPLEMVIPEGQHVRLVVEADTPADTVLALAAQVYEGLTQREIDDIERIALDRQEFFSPGEQA
jgi:predicted DNA-binding antitoxin AbrB/MazE fold protein